MMLYYRQINDDRDRRIAAGQHNDCTPEELSDLGDKALTFRYTF